jgi:gluconate 2-dehydrogenase gamma chain
MSLDHLDRRDLFRIIGAALAAEALDAQHQHQTIPGKGVPKNYQPRFFLQAEYQTIDQLSELLIPADDHSPGAREAGVAWFIDTVLLYADPSRQQTWRQSLAAIDQLTQSRFKAKFLDCQPEQQVTTMEVLAGNEGDPQTPLEHFFAEFKPTVIEAFCLSEVGIKQYFRYRGNTELSDFPGCRPDEIEV